MCEGNAASKNGEGLPVVGVYGQSDDSWCWLCNHSKYSIQMCDGFLTIQVRLIFKHAMAGFWPHIKIYFFKILIALKFLNLV
jgi:hypothetical protein